MGVGGRDRFLRRCRGAGTTGVVPLSSPMVGAVRGGGDHQTLTIGPRERRYPDQDEDPSAGGDFNSLPWRRGPLTRTGSTR